MSEQNPYRYEAGFTIHQHRDELIERLGNAIKQLNTLTAERDALKQQLFDEALAFNHANELVGKYEKEGAALGAQVKQHKLETAIALEVLTRIATPEQIHEATSAIIASRTDAAPQPATQPTGA